MHLIKELLQWAIYLLVVFFISSFLHFSSELDAKIVALEHDICEKQNACRIEAFRLIDSIVPCAIEDYLAKPNDR